MERKNIRDDLRVGLLEAVELGLFGILNLVFDKLVEEGEALEGGLFFIVRNDGLSKSL